MGINYRQRKSHFIRLFDKTPPGIVCPHFYLLAHANGCPYKCSYCYLQLTFRHHQTPVIFSNQDEMIQEVEKFIANQKSPSVLNTGELSDSLVWDDKEKLADILVPMFAKQNRHKVLFLTKSTNIDNLLKIQNHRNSIVSFSINAPEVSNKYELGCPSPEKRIIAAGKCQKAGYEVRLRLDPLIHVPNFGKKYIPLIQLLKENLDLSKIRMTIGSLRYFNGLPYFTEDKRERDIFELPMKKDGPDNRYRAPLTTRVAMYQWMIDQLPEVKEFALCKETEEAWKKLGLDRENVRCNCVL